MAKRTTRVTAKNLNYEDEFAGEKIINKVVVTKQKLKCKNEKQKEFANLISEKEIIIALDLQVWVKVTSQSLRR